MDEAPRAQKPCTLKWNCFPRAMPSLHGNRRPSQVPSQDIRGCLFFFPLKVLKFEKFRHEQDLDVPFWTGQHCLPSLYPVCPQPSSEQQSSPTATPRSA